MIRWEFQRAGTVTADTPAARAFREFGRGSIMAFPCGSVSIANQPIPGTGDFGFVTVAPSDTAFWTDASTDSTFT